MPLRRLQIAATAASAAAASASDAVASEAAKSGKPIQFDNQAYASFAVISGDRSAKLAAFAAVLLVVGRRKQSLVHSVLPGQACQDQMLGAVPCGVWCVTV